MSKEEYFQAEATLKDVERSIKKQTLDLEISHAIHTFLADKLKKLEKFKPKYDSSNTTGVKV